MTDELLRIASEMDGSAHDSRFDCSEELCSHPDRCDAMRSWAARIRACVKDRTTACIGWATIKRLMAKETVDIGNVSLIAADDIYGCVVSDLPGFNERLAEMIPRPSPEAVAFFEAAVEFQRRWNLKQEAMTSEDLEAHQRFDAAYLALLAAQEKEEGWELHRQ